MSLLANFITTAMGSSNDIYKSANTNGLTILLNRIPILNHSKLRPLNSIGLNIVIDKNIIANESVIPASKRS